MIAAGNIGYANYNYYPTPNNSGDPAKSKSMLAAAGYPHGFTLTDVYRNVGNHPAVFTSIQSDLKACGITSKGSPQEQGPYYAFIEDPANAAKWDITEAGWVPDWVGNNGRANVVPLYQTNCVNPTTNYGCYSSPVTDNYIKQALAAPSASAATPLWTKAGEQVMKDAVIVPLTGEDTVLFAGPKVHNLILNLLCAQWNPTSSGFRTNAGQPASGGTSPRTRSTGWPVLERVIIRKFP